MYSHEKINKKDNNNLATEEDRLQENNMWQKFGLCKEVQTVSWRAGQCVLNKPQLTHIIDFATHVSVVSLM